MVNSVESCTEVQQNKQRYIASIDGPNEVIMDW